MPSDLGEFETVFILIMIWVRKTVISKAILPGITSGGITKLIYGK